MTARVRVPLFALLAIVVFAVGCGGDDDGSADAGVADAPSAESASNGDTTVSTSSLDKRAFVKEADAICVRGAESALSYEAESKGQNAGNFVPQAIEQTVAPAFRQVAEELRELGAPAGEEERMEAFLDAFEGSIDELEEQRTSLSSAQEIEGLFHASGQVADELGPAKCAFS